MKKLISKIMIVISFAVLVLCAQPIATQAKSNHIPNGFIIDQRSDETTGNHFALTNLLGSYYNPMGQSFVPSKSKLVGIDFYIKKMMPLPLDQITDFTVTVREGSAEGRILGVSKVQVPATFLKGWQHVSFLPPVKLVPGRQYVFLVDCNRNAWHIVSHGDLSNNYPRGGWILWGQPQGSNDLAFRTYTLKSK